MAKDSWYYENRELVLERQKKFRDENPEIMKQRKHESYLKNKENILSNMKEYYKENKTKILERVSKYVDENRELINEKKKINYSLNKNRILKQMNEFYHENKDKPIMRFRQKAQKANSKSDIRISVSDVQKLYEDNIKQYGTLTCYLCIKPIKFKHDSLEHKIPFCRGGKNKLSNIGIAHIMCNLLKGRKTYKEYSQ